MALGWQRRLLLLIGLRAVLMIIFDMVFVGEFDFSLNQGVQGVALANISAGLVLLVPISVILLREDLLAVPRLRIMAWGRHWFWVAARSGLESLTRNLAFSFMILQQVNAVNEAGLYWTTNNFIWNWLLLPVLALGTLIRRDSGIETDRLGERFRGYFWCVGLIAVFWILLIPGWSWFLSTAMNVPNPKQIVNLAIIMLGFYIVFAFNHVLDSVFYGKGRTGLMLYQSLVVSVFYYGTFFAAYYFGYFQPTLEKIALLFGGGIFFDSVMTLWQFQRAGYFQEMTRQRTGVQT